MKKILLLIVFLSSCLLIAYSGAAPAIPANSSEAVRLRARNFNNYHGVRVVRPPVAIDYHERKNRLTRLFIEKYLSSERIIIKKSLGPEAPEYILRIDTILSSGILCKVYDVVTTADEVFVARVFITDVPNKKMLVDDQELPTNIIYCKHRYYIKANEGLYSYRCNKCKSGFFSLNKLPEVMRGWKLYRTGVVQIGGSTVAKFSMKNPAQTENTKKTETNNANKTTQTPQN